ncbi:MAG: orotate phosphoribosyltransferase [Eggerthellaceae bacterium]|jgi:orotate phosphoribosyltransferase|nr:orotate phosphoribosyltransferase [Eggerthellaceae bacterium]MDR2721448.1 orotate phosphoribosyltransferase [Coriobacteriaceae bacterium]
MQREEILTILKETGSLRSGHFKLTSGRHSDSYIQCARIQEYPTLNNRLAAEAVNLLPEGLKIDLVAAPAVGGIVFGYAVAAALDKRFIWSERVDGAMTLRRSFEVNQGENVLVCEDVVTTGGSVQELIELIEAAGGNVVGVTSMIYRGGAIKFDVAYYPLIELLTPSWDPSECELCAKGINIDSPGSRHVKPREKH